MKFKKIAAVVSAAVLGLALTACGNSSEPAADSNNKPSVQSVDAVSKPTESKKESQPPEEITIAMTEEIKNAAPNSGLVQYNNDIFQRGGYMTVEEFVEKWKDKYDITYRDGSYEERKDYLLEYCNFEKCFNSLVYTGVLWEKRGDFPAKEYPLTLTPKSGVGDIVIAYAVNATSPDEKITLDKAVIIELQPYVKNNSPSTPEWFPMGLNYIYCKDKYAAENGSYNVNNLGDVLEAAGLSKYESFEIPDAILPTLTDTNTHNTFWKHKSGRMGCYIMGEKNLFGAQPLYYYNFTMNSDTDKVDYANCTLEYFYKE